MVTLVHGGDIYTAKEKTGFQEILDFSANINPLGLPESVKNAVIEQVDSYVHYPDPHCRQLVQDISIFEEIPKETILCGNGAADLIFRLVLSVKPKNAILLAPTFAEYEKALEIIGCQVEKHVLLEKDDFQLKEDFLEKLNSSVDILFLCNPNNPTGQLINPSLLEEILIQCKKNGILLVLDECFIDFLENPREYSCKKFIQQFDNLFILKAFTKNFAMAGFRLGYGICSNLDLLTNISATGQPWSVSIPAQIAGVQALQEKEYLEETRKIICDEKQYLIKELEKLKIKVYPGAANYLFFKIPNVTCKEEEEQFQRALLEKGILVRSCSNYTGLDSSYFRIAVKLHKDNCRLIEALQQIRGE